MPKAPTPTKGGTDDSLPVPIVFDLLSNERRLRTLQYLSRSVGAVAISDLADHLALVENEHTRDHFQRVCTSLVHVHVPKLTDAGVLAYDSDAEALELLPAADALAPFLDLAARATRNGGDDGSKSRGQT